VQCRVRDEVFFWVQPVCAITRTWSRDVNNNRQLTWNQGCAEAESCEAGWDDWPYMSQSFVSSGGQAAYTTVEKYCANVSCEPPTGE